MQDSMYSAMFGALTQEHRMNVIANNLANANTSGYKCDRLAFADTFIKYAHDEIREPLFHLRSDPMFPEPDLMAKSRLAESRVDFSQGALQQSDNPMDLALSGEGFFKVRTQNGDFYTRNGSFRPNSQGNLINGDGHYLLGQGGLIALPPTDQIVVQPDGSIIANGQAVDQVMVVDVEDKTKLEKIGQNLFKLRDGAQAGEIPADGTEVVQGFLEKPNIEIVTEMVGMIETQRAFEAYTKMITTTDATDKKVINDVGMVR